MDCPAKNLKIQKKKYFQCLLVGAVTIGGVYLVLQIDHGTSGAVELKSQLVVAQALPEFTYNDWDQMHLRPPTEEISMSDPEQELLELLRSSSLKIDEPIQIKTPVKVKPSSSTKSTSKSTSAKTSSLWKTVRMQVTGYCACSKCCGKSADGITADMHRIRPGDVFVAADKKFPFGTRLIIPGYNRGRSVQVKDRGGMIRGNHLDLYFSSHKTAQKWGVKYLDVRVRLDE